MSRRDATRSGVRQVTGPTDHVVVIGAGLSGLAAALYLRGEGHQVTVIEAQRTPGGRVRTESMRGHLFDTGASVLTMPGLIEAPMAAVGISAASTRAMLDLTPLDPTYHLRYADGTDFAVDRDTDALASSIGSVFGSAQEQGYRRLRTWLEHLYDVEFDDFIDRNFDRLTDFVDNSEMRTRVGQLVRMGAVRHLTPAIGRFISDTRLQRAFTFQALYAGVPPSRALAIYAVISQMDIGMGVWYPRGGMGRIGAVMAQAFTAAGGTILYGHPARRIEFDRSSHGLPRAVAVQTDGCEINCDAVIVTTDTPVTTELLRDMPATRSRRRTRHSPSAVVTHLTVPAEIGAAWPGGHHTIDFGEAWEETFRELTARSGRLMSDPSLLLNRPGLTDPDHFIVDGRESVTVLAPCPNLDSADLPWDALARPYVAEVLSVLESRGYRGIAETARIERIDHPGVWAAAGMSAGTPFAAAHTLAQTGPLRATNLWPGAANVVFAGSSTVPGVGIPPVLVSGRLAAERITG
ncbi:phytoene desaturase family protein [Williamsia phyllosphaerae]|uniref:Phytoene dehydrogenase n=1 Tax=Williamsia phyllosphaerae TaxID=885042 RepID=A0ABQ1UZT0_9NOCA|nr:phytoene desaturase family protein [Williamsia phyllosphaerae]GGF29390.1 phytoene dehydrogenase [Williamsia phyllosphaerae]